MKIIEQSWQWLQKPVDALKIIELAGRVCYKSEDRITTDSAPKFVKLILTRGHTSVLEHCSATVRFITNRGVSHELVRHRLASYSQESTRYVRYAKEVTFIWPVWWQDYQKVQQEHWLAAMQQAEIAYVEALQQGASAEQARDLLPQAVKTELVLSANFREWRHIFALRCAPAAHPQIRMLMRSCLAGFASTFPVVFDDLRERFLSIG